MKGTSFLISYCLKTLFPIKDGLIILIDYQSVLKALDLAFAKETNDLSFC
jgi:hypothetical protein